MSGFYWDNIAGAQVDMARWDRKAAIGRMCSRGGITGCGVNMQFTPCSVKDEYLA